MASTTKLPNDGQFRTKLLLIAFSSLFTVSACKRSQSTQPVAVDTTAASTLPAQVAPRATESRDPVAALKEIVAKVPLMPIPDATTQFDYQGQHYSGTYKVKSFDVQKTDSLISPYRGVIILTGSNTGRIDSDSRPLRIDVTVSLTWREDHWVISSFDDSFTAAADDYNRNKSITPNVPTKIFFFSVWRFDRWFPDTPYEP